MWQMGYESHDRREEKTQTGYGHILHNKGFAHCTNGMFSSTQKILEKATRYQALQQLACSHILQKVLIMVHPWRRGENSSKTRTPTLPIKIIFNPVKLSNCKKSVTVILFLHLLPPVRCLKGGVGMTPTKIEIMSGKEDLQNNAEDEFCSSFILDLGTIDGYIVKKKAFLYSEAWSRSMEISWKTTL